VEVASARPVKQTKKDMCRPAVIATAMGTAAEASGSKVVVGMKKSLVPAQKYRIPAIGVMAEASSIELQESSPNGQTARDSMTEIVSM
jgi:hypothetical protein